MEQPKKTAIRPPAETAGRFLCILAGCVVPAMLTAAAPERMVEHREMTLRVLGGDWKETPSLELAKAADANFETFALLGTLKGRRLVLEWPAEKQIGELAWVQGGYGDWAVPRKLKVTFEDGTTTFWELDARKGLLQTLPVNRTLRRIELEVVEADTEGRQTWGGVAEVGVAAYAPVTLNFTDSGHPVDPENPRHFEKPLGPNDWKLDVTLDSSEAMQLPVTVTVAGKLQYRLPDLVLRPGRKSYTLNFKQAVETSPYQLKWLPCHITGIRIGEDALKTPLTLLDYRRVPDGKSDDWFDLGSFAPPSKLIDGKQFSEGMSYSSAGRFANSSFNGLLTERTDDYYFQVATYGPQADWRSQKFDLWLDGVTLPERVTAGDNEPWNLASAGSDPRFDRIENTWTSSTRTLKTVDGSKLQWRTSILAPGFLLNSNRPFLLTSRGGGRAPVRSGAPNEDERRFFLDGQRDQGTPKFPPSLLITADAIFEDRTELNFEKLSEPWLIAVWGGMESPNWQGDEAIAVLLTCDRGNVVWNENGLHLPAGQYGVSTQFLGLFNPGWEPDKVRQRAAQVMRMLRNYPMQASEFFRVEDDKVEIVNEFTYHPWGDKRFRAAYYAPIPPIYGFGKRYFNWGEFPELNEERRFETPVGPYYWTAGNRLRYSLPRFEAPYTAFPAVPEGRQWYEKLQNWYDQYPDGDMEMVFPGDAWRTPWRPFYWAQGIHGSTLASTETRERLLRAGKFAVEHTLSACCWFPRKERFSGKPYLASLWVDDKVSPVIFGDINTGLGFSAYALYSYVRISGDWALAEKLWPRQMDILRYGEVLNDWAVPLTSARENAHFSGIDMDTIVYAGLCGAERMAEVLGHHEDRDRIAYLRAKVGPATALRLPFRDYFDAKKKAPNLFVQGFAEEGPNLLRARIDDGNVLNLAPTLLSWLGPQPEVFNFLEESLGREFMLDFHRRLWEENLSNPQFDGWRKYNDWISASGGVILSSRIALDWPREEITRDFDLYMKHFTWQTWQGTSELIAAYFATPYGVWLNNWDPAALGALSYDPDTRVLTAQFACDKPFTVRLHAPDTPVECLCDGEKIEWEVRSPAEDRWELSLPPVNGKVSIRLEPKDSVK